MTPRKPGSEGLPWSDPDSDPLADIQDAARKAMEPTPIPDLIDHYAQAHGVSRTTAKRAAIAAAYGADREAVEGILASDQKASAYADMSRSVKNKSGSFDVYGPDGTHEATVRTPKEADGLLAELREKTS